MRLVRVRFGAFGSAMLCWAIAASAQVSTMYHYRTSEPAFLSGSMGARAVSHTVAVALVTSSDSAGGKSIRIDVGPALHDVDGLDLVVTAVPASGALPDPAALPVLYDVISMARNGRISYGTGNSPTPVMRPITGRQPRLDLIDALPGFGLLGVASSLPARRGQSRADTLVRLYRQAPIDATSPNVRQALISGAQMIDTLIVQWRRVSADTVTGTVYRTKTFLGGPVTRISYTKGTHLVVFDRDGTVREATTTLNWDPAPPAAPRAERPPTQKMVYSLVKVGG